MVYLQESDYDCGINNDPVSFSQVINSNKFDKWIDVVASIALPILLLLRYIQTPIQIQIRFQYRSSMLLVL